MRIAALLLLAFLTACDDKVAFDPSQCTATDQQQSQDQTHFVMIGKILMPMHETDELYEIQCTRQEWHRK